MLKLGATVAKWRVRVTPDYCTQCRLCEASCPFGAMREPEASPAGAQALAKDRRRLAWMLALLPVLLAGGGWLGHQFSAPASRLHPTVSLADQLVRAEGTAPKFGALSPDDLALERARQTPKEILTEAAGIRHKFDIGGWIFGAWVGLVIGAKLISLSVRRKRTDYEPDRGDCFACARCFEYCPNELVRRGLMPAAAPVWVGWQARVCGFVRSGPVLTASKPRPRSAASARRDGGPPQLADDGLGGGRLLGAGRPHDDLLAALSIQGGRSAEVAAA